MTKRVKVTLKSETDLLMHADNIGFSDEMDRWKSDPKNKAASKPGDDRTPPWRWMGCLNYDHPTTGLVTIPSEYLMRSMMEGAANVPSGKGQKTFKAQSQSGLLCPDFHWPLLVDGKSIPMAEINKCKTLDTFNENVDVAESLGFTLFIKRAKIGAAKHIRVRPRFSNWSISGEIIITDPLISIDVLQRILDQSGQYKGLGDWRPGSKTPGPWGMFTAQVSV